MHRYSLGLVLFVVTTLVGALSGVQRAAGVPVGPTGKGDLHLRYTPTFTPGPCPGPVQPDLHVNCGYVTVPEDRTHPDGAQVHLAVARIHSPSPDGAASPVVRLTGGPGDPELADLNIPTSQGGPGANPLLATHDLIVFDQRGAGFSQPNLDCPERHDTIWTNLGRNAPFSVELQTSLDAIAQCRARLVSEGVDVTAFDSVANADDVADIRTALGIQSWSILAISYGTVLAQQVMRAHPDGVRAVILDSVVPLDATNADQYIASGERAFDAVFSVCERSPTCNARFPNLRQQWAGILQDYDAHPLAFTLVDSQGITRHVSIDGSDILQILFGALYQPPFIPQIPSLLQLVAARSTAFLSFAVPQIAGGTGALGMQYSVDCRDRFHEVTTNDIVKLIDGNPDYGVVYDVSFSPAYCQTWNAGRLPQSFNNKPASWSAPTLVLAGEFDPVTPPAGSLRVSEQLPDSTFVEIPGWGHGVYRINPCTLSLGVAFLADLTAPLDTSCVSTIKEPF